MRPQLLK